MLPEILRARFSSPLVVLAGLAVSGLTGCPELPEAPVPKAPQLAPLASPTRDAVQVIAGTKAAGTGILVNQLEVVPVDGSTTFVTTFTLREGLNTIAVAAIDGARRTSEVTSLVLILDTTPPAIPAVVAPAATGEDRITLTGSAEAGADVFVDGAPADRVDETGFRAEVALDPGPNSFRVWARDPLGNESEAALVTITRTPAEEPGVHLTVAPVSPEVGNGQLVLRGNRAADATLTVTRGATLLDEVPPGSVSWEADVMLVPGINELVVTATNDDGQSTHDVTVDFVTGPAPPTLDPLPASVPSPVVITGGKPTRTAVLREDGSPVTALDDATTFTDALALPPGPHTLTYRTRDAWGRVSAPVSVEIVVEDSTPAATLAYPPARAVVGASFVVEGAAADEDGIAQVSVCLGPCDDESGFVLADLGEPDVDDSAGAVPFSALVDTSALPASLDGTLVNLHLRVEDSLGHRLDHSIPVKLLRRPLSVSRDPAFERASLAADLDVGPAGELAVAFSHPTGPVGSDVYLVLEDGTGADSPALLLSDEPGFGFAEAPLLARTADGTLHTLWLDDGPAGSDEPGRPSLVHRAVSDGVPGASLAVQGQGGVSAPDVVATSSGLAAVWRREVTEGARDYVVELSFYDGAGWSVPLVVAADGEAGAIEPGEPRVAVSDDGRVHVVWSDGPAGNRDIHIRAYDAALATFTLPRVVSEDVGTFADGGSTRPVVAAVGPDADHRVVVAWIETGAMDGEGAGRPKVALRTLDDDGAGAVREASPPDASLEIDEVDLALDDTGAGALVFVARGGDLEGSGADSDVFLRRYDDATGSLGEVAPVSDLASNTTSTSESVGCRVAVDDIGNTHVIWREAADLDGTHAGPDDVDVMTLAIGPEAP